MKANEIKNMVKSGELVPVDGIVEVEGKKYSVTGSKRMVIKPVRVKKEKVKKTIEARACDKCGKSFTPSKFNPYFTECPDCRSKHRLAAPIEARKCDKCGKSFVPSKFNPYFTVCPDCRKAAKPKKEKIAKKSKKAKKESK